MWQYQNHTKAVARALGFFVLPPDKLWKLAYGSLIHVSPKRTAIPVTTMNAKDNIFVTVKNFTTRRDHFVERPTPAGRILAIILSIADLPPTVRKTTASATN